MKGLKSQFLLVLAIVITMMSSISAFANDGIVPRWSYLWMISADLDVDDYNSATVSVEASRDPTDTDSLKVTTKLQQFNGGWKTYKSWTDNIDDSFAMIEKYTAIPKGYSYRIQVTVSTYKNGKFLESATENFEYGFYQ